MDKSLAKNPHRPYYQLSNFVTACSMPSAVTVLKRAQEDADKDFKLRTRKEILDFIVGGGLEDLVFVNAKPWENNPRPEQVIIVDAYEFRALFQLGYIAFFKATTDRWMIKSFHRSDNANPAMALALRKAGLLPGGSDV